MRFTAYTVLNGACSAIVGALFVVAGFPGLLGDERGYAWLAAPAVFAVLASIGLWARRRGTPLGAPGRWLTDRPLAAARPGAAPLDVRRLRWRLLGETVLWAALALAIILGVGSSRPFAYATGWASLAYGLLELLASAPQIRAAERSRGVVFLVCRRPGLGTPDVTY